METYKGYEIIVKRAGIHGGYEANAYKRDEDENFVYELTIRSPRFLYAGAKKKARDYVVAKIDAAEQSVEPTLSTSGDSTGKKSRKYKIGLPT